MSLLSVKSEQQRKVKDAEHQQRLRHLVEVAEAESKAEALKHDEELRRFEALKQMGVDLTKYLCTVGDRPDQHIRIDAATPPALHMEMPKGRSK